MGKPTVAVVVLTRGNMRAELSQYLQWLIATERRYNLHIGFSCAQPIVNNRNLIVKNFLARGADYLLSLDDDSMPTGNVLDLVERDLDVVGFPYLTWRANDDPPLLWFPAAPSGQRLVEVEAVGGGCLLIARRVLENTEMQYMPFNDVYANDNALVQSEDIHFCFRARQAGFKIWCDFNTVLLHWKTVELFTIWQYLQKEIARCQSST